MIATDLSHKKKIRDQLAGIGMSRYGLVKASTRYLYHVIHNDEQIMAAAYGRYHGGSAIFVATDRRFVFLDHKPGFTMCDEISYDMISGVKLARAGAFSSLTVHSGMGNYHLRYVNHTSARRFVDYIEQVRLAGRVPQTPSVKLAPAPSTPISPEAKAFLVAHDTAVLSSQDRGGNVYGAVVYYLVGENDKLYFLTRADTAKARNILAHQQVALTIYEDDPARTLQLSGTAAIETDELVKSGIFHQMTMAREYRGGSQSPPVTSLSEGAYVVIAITPTVFDYRPYQAAVTE